MLTLQRFLIAALLIPAATCGCSMTSGMNCHTDAKGNTDCTSNSFTFNSNGSGPLVVGNGKFVRVARSANAIDTVETRGSVDIVSRPGPTGVVVAADSNIAPLISTKVANGTLTVSDDGSYSTHNPVTVYVTSPAITSVQTSGSADIDVSNADPTSVDVNIQGSGDIKLSGQTQSVSLTTSGSGDVDAKNLKAQSADITVSGSSDVTVSASQTAKVDVSGSGDVDIYGHPSMTQNISGSGDVNVH